MMRHAKPIIIALFATSCLSGCQSSNPTSNVRASDLVQVEVSAGPEPSIRYTNNSDAVLKAVTYTCGFAWKSGGAAKSITDTFKAIYPLPPGQSVHYSYGAKGVDFDNMLPTGCRVTQADFFPDPADIQYVTSTPDGGGPVSLQLTNTTDHEVSLSKPTFECVWRVEASARSTYYGEDYDQGYEKGVTGKQEGRSDDQIVLAPHGTATAHMYNDSGFAVSASADEWGSASQGGDKYFQCYFASGSFRKRSISLLAQHTIAQPQRPAPQTSNMDQSAPASSASEPDAASSSSVSPDAPQPAAPPAPEAGAPAQGHTPSPGSPEREAIMEAMRPRAEQIAKKPVIFRVVSLTVTGNHAHAVVVPLGQDGQPARPYGQPFTLAADLERNGGGWTLTSMNEVTGDE